MHYLEKDIFKAGSTTYYWSSKFFPKGVRDDVFKLYSFVRVVDDLVDTSPPEIQRFENIVSRWQTIKKELKSGALSPLPADTVDERVLANIAYIVHRYECDPKWVDAFLISMQMDIDKRTYNTLDDTLEYIYGSAEVIGLFMSRIMQLPIKPYEYAMMQGRAMQFINFLRDIAEDNDLGRCYFPVESLSKYQLKDLSYATAVDNPVLFREFMLEQLSLYELWQAEAEKGFPYIPRRLLIPLKTAVEMYNWTAEQIKKDPFIVFQKKVKPSKSKVVSTAARLAIP